MVLVRNCIREIRKTVFGRDMRKPIAAACEYIRKKYRGTVVIKRLEEVTAEEITGKEDFYSLEFHYKT